jgi:hypothetical protein
VRVLSIDELPKLVSPIQRKLNPSLDTCLGLEHREIASINDNAGQVAGCVGPGINIHAIVPYVGHAHWGVTMDNEFPEIVLGEQKVVADPKEVFRALPIEGAGRVDAGVDEEIVAADKLCLQQRQELSVGFGKRLDEGPGQGLAFEGVRPHRRLQAIGQQGFLTAEITPAVKESRIFQEIEDKGLMIALQKYRVMRTASIG